MTKTNQKVNLETSVDQAQRAKAFKLELDVLFKRYDMGLGAILQYSERGIIPMVTIIDVKKPAEQNENKDTEQPLQDTATES